MCKVINIFGEPGAGKSALAAYVFYRLKVLGYNVELVDEFAKSLVYEDNKVSLENQAYVFGMQTQKMNRLKSNVDIIVTDSPLILCGMYMEDEKLYNGFFNVVYDIFNKYDNMNYLLERNHAYVEDGRLQNEQQAAEIRKKLITELEHFKIPYIELKSSISMPNEFRNESGEKIVTDIISQIQPKYKFYDCEKLSTSIPVKRNTFKKIKIFIKNVFLSKNNNQ